jgi:hypothetical protein
MTNDEFEHFKLGVRDPARRDDKRYLAAVVSIE